MCCEKWKDATDDGMVWRDEVWRFGMFGDASRVIRFCPWCGSPAGEEPKPSALEDGRACAQCGYVGRLSISNRCADCELEHQQRLEEDMKRVVRSAAPTSALDDDLEAKVYAHNKKLEAAENAINDARLFFDEFRAAFREHAKAKRPSREEVEKALNRCVNEKPDCPLVKDMMEELDRLGVFGREGE